MVMCVDGHVEARVLDGSAHTVAAFAHRGVGQAHGVKVVLIGLDSREVDFDIDDVRVDAIDSGAESFEEHKSQGWCVEYTRRGY